MKLTSIVFMEELKMFFVERSSENFLIDIISFTLVHKLILKL